MLFSPLKKRRKSVTTSTDQQRAFFIRERKDVIFCRHSTRRKSQLDRQHVDTLVPHLHQTLQALITMAFAGSVAACGGGGGSTNPPDMGNRAPFFDRTSYEFSLQENSGILVGSVSASDPDGDTISLSVSGTDGASFSITNAGEVSLIETPDYEAPIDADSDKRYEVTITASDGELTRSV